ncbi:hypothetical protein [Yokenella regensburgei]|uniref:hypothetical protein n=1 Tax=Yokenella regensburgei TaxID=158877 RepID=UPI0035B0EECC
MNCVAGREGSCAATSNPRTNAHRQAGIHISLHPFLLRIRIVFFMAFANLKKDADVLFEQGD